MIVRVTVQSASGEPVQGQSVNLTGCGDEPRTTGPTGIVQFLVDDSIPTTTISIGGAAVWSGPSAELRGNEVFEQAGAGFTRK
jgi:hypothetical protein